MIIERLHFGTYDAVGCSSKFFYHKHFRIKKYRKEGNPFTDGPVRVNSIESFWSYTKRRLARFNGIKANFELHLKECE